VMTAAVPEPETYALILSGLLLLAARGRVRRGRDGGGATKA